MDDPFLSNNDGHNNEQDKEIIVDIDDIPCCNSIVCKPFVIFFILISITYFIAHFIDPRSLLALCIITIIYELYCCCRGYGICCGQKYGYYMHSHKIGLIINAFILFLMYWYGAILAVWWVYIAIVIFGPIFIISFMKIHPTQCISTQLQTSSWDKWASSWKFKIFVCFIGFLIFGANLFVSFYDAFNANDFDEITYYLQDTQEIFAVFFSILFLIFIFLLLTAFPIWTIISFFRYLALLKSIIKVKIHDIPTVFDKNEYKKHVDSIKKKIVINRILTALLILMFVQFYIFSGLLFVEVSYISMIFIRIFQFGTDICVQLFLVILSYLKGYHFYPLWSCKQCGNMNEDKKDVICRICGTSKHDILNENTPSNHKNTKYNAETNENKEISVVYAVNMNKEQRKQFKYPFLIRCSMNNVLQCTAYCRIQILCQLFDAIRSSNNFDSFIKQFYDLSNGSRYGRIDLLNDFIHLIQDHDINDMDKMFANCTCNEYNDRNKHFKDRKNLLITTMHQMHCYIYHNIERYPSETITPRIYDKRNGRGNKNYIEEKKEFKAAEEDKEEQDAKNDDNDDVDNEFMDSLFEFGSFIYYQFLKPKYSHFKEELLNNEVYSIDLETWSRIYEKVRDKLLTNAARKLRAFRPFKNEQSRKRQMIEIGDMMAIKLYTDETNAQYYFCKTFRKWNKNETDNDIIVRHCNNYYFWGKWLNHAISNYGDRIVEDKKNKEIYFRGLSTKFIFSSLGTDFNIPTSVSKSLRQAQNFAGYDGIIIQLKSKYDGVLNRTRALSVEWISKYPDEREVLLFGNFNQLIIYNIIPINDIFDKNVQNRHKVKLEAIIYFEKMCDGDEKMKKLKQSKIASKGTQILEELINEEINTNYNKNDYISKLFHRICAERKYFTIKSILKTKKLLKIFENLLEKNVNININHNINNNTIIKCNECGSFCSKVKAVICCTSAGNNCGNFLCLRCGNIISILQKIMPNSVHVKTSKNALDRVKKDALKIELLRSKKLF